MGSHDSCNLPSDSLDIHRQCNPNGAIDGQKHAEAKQALQHCGTRIWLQCRLSQHCCSSLKSLWEQSCKCGCPLSMVFSTLKPFCFNSCPSWEHSKVQKDIHVSMLSKLIHCKAYLQRRESFQFTSAKLLGHHS